MYGYTKPLFVLPFDHRGSFAKGLFSTENPDSETLTKIYDMKNLIYEAIFESQKTLDLPKDHFAILVDELYGQTVLENASAKGLIIIQTTEKSSLDEFDFQYEEFGEHLKKYNATFAKALVRYNPAGDTEANHRSREKLKKLSDWCHGNGVKLLIEPLVPATEEQLTALDNDKHRYDTELRPQLSLQMVSELQNAGIECDVWKIEGFEKTEDYEAFVAQTRNTPERAEVATIILGRNETKENVAKWITAGKNVPGVVGFAVGRTVFWGPLVEYRDGKISRDVAKEKIAEGFTYFTKIFLA